MNGFGMIPTTQLAFHGHGHIILGITAPGIEESNSLNRSFEISHRMG